MNEPKLTKSKESTNEVAFTKAQLLKSKKYIHQTDVLSVILEDGKNYTIKEVEKLVDGFMKKEVK